jgi:hypothetical protein
MKPRYTRPTYAPAGGLPIVGKVAEAMELFAPPVSRKPLDLSPLRRVREKLQAQLEGRK